MEITIENQCETGVDITDVIIAQNKQIPINAGEMKTIQVNSIDSVTVVYIEHGISQQPISHSHFGTNKLTLFRMSDNNTIVLR
jgi:hypothetical protein